jgi:hypothetical protein
MIIRLRGILQRHQRRSGYPGRYEPQAHDGIVIAGAMWDRSPDNMAVYR